MAEEELFALNDSGTTYHKRDCQHAKTAGKFVPLKNIPPDAKPCGRCDPPVRAVDVVCDGQEPAPQALPEEPAVQNEELREEGERGEGQDEPFMNNPAPEVPEPKKSGGKAVCMRGCAINGVWIPAGTVVDAKDVKGSSHFREI